MTGLFENELILQFCMMYGSVITSACAFAFIFAIRHKRYFTQWARMSIFLTFCSSLMLTLIPISGIEIMVSASPTLIGIKVFLQTTLAWNVFTLIRTQWSWQEDFRIEMNCEKEDCPLIVRINNDKSEE